MPPKPKSSQSQRKQRVYRRRQQGERATAAFNDAANREADMIRDELAVLQHESIPEDERGQSWQEVHGQLTSRLADTRAAIAATDAHAEKLNGKPFSRDDKRNRVQRVKTARREIVERLVDAWEDIMAGHERNLDRLESIPEAQREAWRGDIAGVPTLRSEQNPEALGGMTWQDAWDANEAALDTHERAAEQAHVMLDGMDKD